MGLTTIASKRHTRHRNTVGFLRRRRAISQDHSGQPVHVGQGNKVPQSSLSTIVQNGPVTSNGACSEEQAMNGRAGNGYEQRACCEYTGQRNRGNDEAPNSNKGPATAPSGGERRGKPDGKPLSRKDKRRLHQSGKK